MPRLFVALDLPEPACGEVDRLGRGLPDALWTPAEKLHLTLRFVGETDMPTFVEIGEALASITQAPFELRLRGIGHFPTRGALRHLWVGVEANPGLDRLRRQIERVMRDCGIEPERRRFVPHVTIARFYHPPPPGRMASWLARRSLFSGSPFIVENFHLFSSILRPEGSHYSVEATYDFVRGVMFQP